MLEKHIALLPSLKNILDNILVELKSQAYAHALIPAINAGDKLGHR